MEIFFPGGSQPSWNITEIPGGWAGGGGMTSTARNGNSRGGGGDVAGLKQKCPAWGEWILFGTTH